MKRGAYQFLFVALAIGALVGLYVANQSYRAHKERQQWMDQLTADFNDPAAAQFRNLKQNYEALCGEVNGKNKFGAYVGFKRFYSGRSGARMEPDVEEGLEPGSLEARAAASNERIWRLIYDAKCSHD